MGGTYKIVPDEEDHEAAKADNTYAAVTSNGIGLPKQPRWSASTAIWKKSVGDSHLARKH